MPSLGIDRGDGRWRELRGKSVTIVGAGPSGLTAAVICAQAGAKVRVLHRDDLGRGLGGDHAAGLVEIVANKDKRCAKWLRAQLKFYEQLHNLGAQRFGVQKTKVDFYSDRPIEEAWLIEMPELTDIESPHALYPYALSFSTFVIDTPKFLAALVAAARRFGVTFEQREVQTVDEVLLGHPDVAIIAAGIDNAWLWPDPTMAAGWGVTLRWNTTRWPNVTTFYNGTNSMAYAIPRAHREVIAGGTNLELEVDDPGTLEWGVELVDEVMEHLYEDLPPGMAQALFRIGRPSVRVAPRPLGPQVRLDVEVRNDVVCLTLGSFGGSGFTVSYGAVVEGLRLVTGTLTGPEAWLHTHEGHVRPMTLGPLDDAEVDVDVDVDEHEVGVRTDGEW